MSAPLFADVIVPLPLPGLFTYLIPEDIALQAAPGKRVLVQFGARKVYTGIIRKIHRNEPKIATKPLLSILDEYAVVNKSQLELWDWISNYYLCYTGDVLKAALPSGLKMESESVVTRGPLFEEYEPASEKENSLMEDIHENGSIKLKELAAMYPGSAFHKTLGKLIAATVLSVEESVKETYREKTEVFYNLHPDIDSPDLLDQCFQSLTRAPRQVDALLVFTSLAKPFSPIQREIRKSEILAKIKDGTPLLNELVKKQILVSREKRVSRLDVYNGKTQPPAILSKHQKKALSSINEQFRTEKPVLLHGITSSGKTEIYLHLITETVKKGKQVLYLLPEIALTHQIIQRLQMVLGDTVGVYHSKYGDAARLETYLDLLKPEEERKYSVILGVRSSVFLPFTNLGLIIVDEEHESSYKQFDPAPRYHARDVSLVLARMHKANVLLGTATPSVETYYNTENGKYCLTELFVRHTEISLPEIITVDTREAHHKKEMLSHFSHVLIEELKTTVANGKQAILFLNRRGFSPYLKCFECGWVPGCIHCDVKLTWHKNQKKLICHYCGHSVSVPEDCMECGNPELKTMGFGTEKIEEELTTILPGIRFGRMDLDTTRSRDSAAKIIAAFESRQIDVLVGTQMISKGLDFDDVLLVGIVNADHMLNFPDFRAHERSFQLMAQVAGRAGRKGTTGKVLIQTTEPEHKIIGYVKDNDFISFYNSQIDEREKFLYPPFVRLIALTVKHKRLDLAHMAAKKIHDFLGKALGTQLGPVHTPLVGRVQEYYLQKMLIRIGHDSKLSEAKALVLHSLNEMQKIDLFKGLLYTVDVDPA